MARKMSKQVLPNTDSIEELAKFWDEHDVTEFDDELEEVVGPVFERKTEDVCVALEPDDLKAIKRIAESRGIEYRTLVREWVLEKIHTF
jgi:predicted DNA binding CopG/RHH family protein